MITLPAGIVRRLRAWAHRHMAGRDADIHIGGRDNPYLLRWHVLPRNSFLNIYLHEMRRDDDDRALHDHPWLNASIILQTGYDEIIGDAVGQPVGRVRRRPGDVILRGPRAAHRLAIPAVHEAGDDDGNPISLFLTGPRLRVWGFWCPQGWRDWRDFTAGPNGETVGRGCE